MEIQLPSAAIVGVETDRICSRNITIYIKSKKLINIYLKSSYVSMRYRRILYADIKNAIGFRRSLLVF